MAKKLRRRVSGRVLEHSNITAVGAMIYCSTTERVLFLLRGEDTYSNFWGLVGGRIEANETVLQALDRECKEEVGYRIVFDHIVPLECYQSSDNHFQYHTFICVVDKEFIPHLSREHKGYCWTPIENAPKPLHPGLYNSLSAEVVKRKLESVRDFIRV